MKLITIGLGQCGSRVADEFARLNSRAQAYRHIQIIPGIFAVNTDAADLSGLKYISADYQHRIVIGGRKTSGHGVGKINELGAEIAKSEGDKVIDAVRTVKNLFESDGFLLVAGTGGGTGSGSVAVIAKLIKERYSDMPVYALLVLPFEHEESTEERTVYNTATCLKSVNEVADAVFLVDNQRYVSKDFSLANNMARINAMIVEPFYNVLCAGEEKKGKFVGAKTLDAGDIMATLSGWTVIGYGESDMPLMWFPFQRTRHFYNKSREINKGPETMNKALGELSLSCRPADAGRALYLLTAPVKEMNMNLVKDLGDYLRDLCPEATIRSGDYPRERGLLNVTIVLSELKEVEKVRRYYERSTQYIPELQKRKDEIEAKLKAIDDAAKEVPCLL